MNRRGVLKIAGGGAAMLASGPAAQARSRPPVFVLVHGAWHGGWCWRDVRDRLEATGARVLTPTLTGLGERAHLLSPNVGLETHIQDVLAVIACEELSDVVLCGHSYGGMVITGVYDRARASIRHVVYLDAAVPTDGQAFVNEAPDATPASIAQNEAFVRALAPDGLAMAVPTDVTLLGVPTDHPKADWLRRWMTPHPARTWLDPIHLTLGGSAPHKRTYILCNAPVMVGAAFAAHAARIRTDPTWRYAEVAAGHDAMIIAPDAVARLFLEAAASGPG